MDMFITLKNSLQYTIRHLTRKEYNGLKKSLTPKDSLRMPPLKELKRWMVSIKVLPPRKRKINNRQSK